MIEDHNMHSIVNHPTEEGFGTLFFDDSSSIPCSNLAIAKEGA